MDEVRPTPETFIAAVSRRRRQHSRHLRTPVLGGRAPTGPVDMSGIGAARLDSGPPTYLSCQSVHREHSSTAAWQSATAAGDVGLAAPSARSMAPASSGFSAVFSGESLVEEGAALVGALATAGAALVGDLATVGAGLLTAAAGSGSFRLEKMILSAADPQISWTRACSTSSGAWSRQ